MIELHFTPRTQIETSKAQEVLIDFTYEWNAEFGCFIFEEAEETIDDLEEDLQELFDLANVRGYFEFKAQL